MFIYQILFKLRIFNSGGLKCTEQWNFYSPTPLSIPEIWKFGVLSTSCKCHVAGVKVNSLFEHVTACDMGGELKIISKHVSNKT